MWPFSSENDRKLKDLRKIAKQVLALEGRYAAMSEEELKSQTLILKTRLANGETLDQILPDAFAVVREASFRTLGYRHYPEQIIGGIALHQGRIAEMGTGEGKTLTATLPSYLNALLPISEDGSIRQSVHVVTVNDYLARRDAEKMGQIYEFLGLTVGVIVPGLSKAERREAYGRDIVYATNNELGFDYLRDNRAKTSAGKVQRPLGEVFLLLDEMDSILIDEARTPLIISEKGEKPSPLYERVNAFVSKLKMRIEEDDEPAFMIGEEADVLVHLRSQTVLLTANGDRKAEAFFTPDELKDLNLTRFLRNAMMAHFLKTRGKDYIVVDGKRGKEVVIVDESTGRQMPGRRYSEGLHQAIEAKEGVEIRRESVTVASITSQNFFRKYRKMSGMTGTAKTEEKEFQEVYKLDVVEVPPHKVRIRTDEPDQVFIDYDAKMNAILDDIERCFKTGQPVLVGTVSVNKSKKLSALLKARGIPHEVLNAENHEREAEIVAKAGKFGAVTIATNMAGRGTDIELGGGDPEEKEKVKALGGLRVIGTERHESRRIDNQLRGRSGRQGDPGSSVFYLSLETNEIDGIEEKDGLAKFYGSAVRSFLQKFGWNKEEALTGKKVSKLVEKVQKGIEEEHSAQRKRLLDFDWVMNHQREIVYESRNRILDGGDVHQIILNMIPQVVGDIVKANSRSATDINSELERAVLPKGTNLITEAHIREFNKAELADFICKKVIEFYETKVATVKDQGTDFSNSERVILLQYIDIFWTQHIDNMDYLRKVIGLRAIGGQDPVLAYRQEGYEMFSGLQNDISLRTLNMLLKGKIEVAKAKEERTHHPSQKAEHLKPAERPHAIPVEILLQRLRVKNGKKRAEEDEGSDEKQ